MYIFLRVMAVLIGVSSILLLSHVIMRPYFILDNKERL